jgi:phage tail protein X
MVAYRTVDGDMVDAICQEFYGAVIGYVEQVYLANPGLAAYGPRLPAGLLIELPEVAAAEPEQRMEELWD